MLTLIPSSPFKSLIHFTDLIQIQYLLIIDVLDSRFQFLILLLAKRCDKPDRKEFSKVAVCTAIGFVVMETGEMGPNFTPKTLVKSLTPQQIVRIHQLSRQAKFDDPRGDCLSPAAGEYNIRLGIIKELHPDMVATYTASAQVFEGHPFIVEAAGVSLGGKNVKQLSKV